MQKLNDTLLEIIHELVRKAYYCIYATNEDRVVSEGGLVTSAKCYLKSAVVVAHRLQPMTYNKECFYDIMKMLEELMKIDDKKIVKFDVTRREIRVRLERVKRDAKWLKNTIEKKLGLWAYGKRSEVLPTLIFFLFF